MESVGPEAINAFLSLAILFGEGTASSLMNGDLQLRQ